MTVKILSTFVAFLENMNSNMVGIIYPLFLWGGGTKTPSTPSNDGSDIAQSISSDRLIFIWLIKVRK